MPRVLPAAFLAFAVTAAASAAQAATFINFAAPAPNGSISGTFGSNGISTPNFVDVFDFSWPAVGTTSVTFSTIGFGTTDITFTSATLNGETIDLSPDGVFEFGSLFGLETAAGPQQLIITGTSGGAGSYSGTLSFDLAALVPEPASWAMMITGFGGVGVLIRRRRAYQTPA
jgi:hypothetical protein